MNGQRPRHAFVIAVSVFFGWSAAVRGQPPSRTPTEREQLRKQVIYLVLLDRFFNGNPGNDAPERPAETDSSRKNLRLYHGGDVAGVAKKRDYLMDLGVNTVWITPVYKQVAALRGGATGYHGYWPDFTDPDDQAIEPRFGTKQELEGLITSMHEAQIRFILDKVVNHAGYNARIRTTHPDWFHRDPPLNPDDFVTSPLAGLPDFKQEDPVVARYLTDMGRRWVKAFELDGVRMDTAKHVPLDYWKQDWIPAVRKERPKLFLLSEVMNGSGEYSSVTVLKKFLDAGFDSSFNFWLRNALTSSLGRNGSLDGVATSVRDAWVSLGEERALLLCNLLDNHDTPRFTNEPGVNVSEEEIRRRYHAALLLLFTLPGIPQLYYGGELAMYGNEDRVAGNRNRRSMPDWAWTELGRKGPRAQRDPDNPRLCLPEPDVTYRWCRDLIRTRAKHPALYNGYYAELWRPNGGQNLYAFFRSDGANRVAVFVNESDQTFGLRAIPVVGNGDIRKEDQAAFRDGAKLQRIIGQNSAPETFQVSGGQMMISMPARSVGVYRLQE